MRSVSLMPFLLLTSTLAACDDVEVGWGDTADTFEIIEVDTALEDTAPELVEEPVDTAEEPAAEPLQAAAHRVVATGDVCIARNHEWRTGRVRVILEADGVDAAMYGRNIPEIGGALVIGLAAGESDPAEVEVRWDGEGAVEVLVDTSAIPADGCGILVMTTAAAGELVFEG